MNNTISVVLTTYNRKYELRRALESVLEQSVKPFEVIIIDDASTDCTKEYIDTFHFECINYVLLDKHCGAGAARNHGVKLAKGEFVAFLDSDNEWYKTKLEEFANIIKSDNSSWDLICSKYKKHIFFSEEVWPKPLSNISYNENKEIWLHNVADASASLYRKSFLEEINGFSESLKKNLDWELLMRGMEKRDIVIKKVDKVLSENWTMYDGLSAYQNAETEIEGGLELFHEYYDQILKQGCGESYLLQYLNDTAGKISEPQAIEKLLKACNYSIEWMEVIINSYKNKERAYAARLERKSSFYSLIYQWFYNELTGKTILQKLNDMNIKSISIYGAGKHGKLLYQNLKGSDIQIKYFIDRNKDALDGSADIAVYSLEEQLPAVDAVVVSTYMEFNIIKEKMQNKGTFKIIALDELINL